MSANAMIHAATDPTAYPFATCGLASDPLATAADPATGPGSFVYYSTSDSSLRTFSTSVPGTAKVYQQVRGGSPEPEQERVLKSRSKTRKGREREMTIHLGREEKRRGRTGRKAICLSESPNESAQCQLRGGQSKDNTSPPLASL